MRHYFVLNGVPSIDFGVYLAEANIMDAAERDYSEVTVPGRSGTLLYDNNRWANITLTITAYISDSIKEKAQAFRTFLLSLPGYVRYEDTLHPDEYRMVRTSGSFKISKSDRAGGSFSLSFSCKPYRYVKDGEDKLEFTGASTLYNPYAIPAKPLLRIYGYGTIVVGTGKIKIASDVGEYIDIDCEMKDAYVGTENRNSFITVTQWPELTQGDNSIALSSTISKIEITPRWVTL
jgi:phage-related protein